jgi:hypothetical protein
MNDPRLETDRYQIGHGVGAVSVIVKGVNSGGIVVTPSEAKELAAALVVQADAAERAQRQRLVAEHLGGANG